MRDQQGCSLIEVLIATLILAVGVASLAQLFTVAIASNISATHRTRAAMLGAQKLEEVRSLDWNTARQSGGADMIGEYRRRWSVEALPANPQSALIIDVRITWNGSPVGHLATIKSRTSP